MTSKHDFTFMMPTTVEGTMEQLIRWTKTLTVEEKAEVRQALQKQLKSSRLIDEKLRG